MNKILAFYKYRQVGCKKNEMWGFARPAVGQILGQIEK